MKDGRTNLPTDGASHSTFVDPGHFFTRTDKTIARHERAWAWNAYKQGRIDAARLRTTLARTDTILNEQEQ